jgi:hypothetical protein
MIDGEILEISVSDMAQFWVIMRSGGTLQEQMATVECRSRPLGLSSFCLFFAPSLIQIMLWEMLKKNPPPCTAKIVQMLHMQDTIYICFL